MKLALPDAAAMSCCAGDCLLGREQLDRRSASLRSRSLGRSQALWDSQADLSALLAHDPRPITHLRMEEK